MNLVIPAKHRITRRAARVGLAWFVVSVGLLPARVHAEEFASVSVGLELGKVDAFRGSYSTALPLSVPDFRGITPRLALSYGGGSSSGISGVGWSLDFGKIERVGPRGGTPSFTSADTYTLGSEELVPCVGGSVSPSCTSGGAAGGTHSTKIENYQRIRFDAGANQWVMTAPNGVVSRYTSIQTVSATTVAWGLSTVTDTKNNVVTYFWSADGIYPDRVSYNLTLVQLYYETRPDPYKKATGASLLTIASRLKSIDIKVNNARLRAYKLGYTQSSRTGQSQLASFQTFGRDASVAGDGTVTGPTSLPAQTFAYAAEAGGPFAAFEEDIHSTASHYTGGGWSSVLADYTGDGKADLCAVRQSEQSETSGSWLTRCMIGNGNGTFGDEMVQAQGTFNANYGETQWTQTVLAQDVDGDGKQDLCLVPNGMSSFNLQVRCIRSNGDGTFAPATAHTFPNTTGWSKGNGFRPSLVDLNRDGKVDYCVSWLWPSVGFSTYCAAGTGAGTFAALNPHNVFPASVWLLEDDNWAADFIDIDGDGLDDVCALENKHKFELRCARSNGDGTFGPSVVTPHQMFTDGSTTLDLNGDGATDYCSWNDPDDHTEDGGYITLKSRCLLNNGNGTFSSYVEHDFGTFDRWTLLPMDVNGDGRSDACWQEHTGDLAMTKCFLGKGNGTFGAIDSSQIHFNSSLPNNANGFYWTHLQADYNGDGLMDLCSIYTGQDLRSRCMLNQGGGASFLLTSMANGLGGTSTIGYTPSSAFAHAHSPPISQLVTSIAISDGRASPESTATTTYSYANGLYDPIDRRPLGFRYVKATSPCIAGESQCPYSETWYKQDYGSVSKPERSDQRSGDGKLLASTSHVYTINGSTVPYTSLETGLWAYQFDGTLTAPCSSWDVVGAGGACATGVRKFTNRAYDAFANVELETSYGDYDVSGDEVLVWTRHIPNTSAYLVNYPALLTTFDGTTMADYMLAQQVSYYDGNAAWEVAPTSGLFTTSVTWLNTAGSHVVSTTKSYDFWGNVTSEWNALGATNTYTFDGTYHLFALSTTFAAGTALARTQSQLPDYVCGEVLSSLDIQGRSTTRTYDALCRNKTITPLGGVSTTHTWVNTGDPNNYYAQVTESDGSWSRSYHDGLGRKYKTVKKGPSPSQDIIEETVYNARGGVAKKSNPYYAGATPQWVVTTFDAADRPSRITAPDGTFLTRSYGARGVTEVDSLGHQTTEQQTGAVVEHIETFESASKVTRIEILASLHIKRVTDSAGSIRNIESDSLSRIVSVSDPNHGTSTYSYDAGGNMTAAQDALGQRKETVFDVLGRKTQTLNRRADGSVESTVTFSYDQVRNGYYNVGMLTRMTDASGSETYDYDVQDRRVKTTRIIDGISYTTYASFDAEGKPLGMKYPDGYVLGDNPTTGPVESPFTYDAAGRLYAIPGIVTSTLYDASGEVTSRTNANGTVTTYGYSATRGWLDTINTVKGATTLQNLGYTRNSLGLVTKVTSPFCGEGWSYGYDELNRLVSALNHTAFSNNQAFAYGANGNLLSNSRIGDYTYGGAGGARPHAVTAVGANSYAYNANGNLTSGAGRTLTWTVDNLPASITTGGTTSAFVYDGRQARIKKTVGGQTTLYLGADYEISPSGTVTKYFRAGNDIVAKRQGANNFWLHTDHAGSVQVVTDADGNVAQRKSYRPYGESLATSTSHSESRGFTGQRQDETGLIYLSARYYDPALGRFISPDPVFDTDDAGRMNGYSYAGNDPVNHTDASGLWFKKLFKTLAKFVVPVLKVVVRIGLSMALNAVIPGCGVLIGNMIVGAVVGAVSTAIDGGGIKEILQNAVGGAAGGAIQSIPLPQAGGMLVHHAAWYGREVAYNAATVYADGGNPWSNAHAGIPGAAVPYGAALYEGLGGIAKDKVPNTGIFGGDMVIGGLPYHELPLGSTKGMSQHDVDMLLVDGQYDAARRYNTFTTGFGQDSEFDGTRDVSAFAMVGIHHDRLVLLRLAGPREYDRAVYEVLKAGEDERQRRQQGEPPPDPPEERSDGY